MKARYTGAATAEEHRPFRVGFAGKSFPRGVFVDVSEVPAHLQAKLAANPSFDTSDEALTAEELAAADAVNGVGDDDGAEPAAAHTASMGKPDLIAALEALQGKHPEFKFNPKASAAKLQQQLDDAQFEYGDDE